MRIHWFSGREDRPSKSTYWLPGELTVAGQSPASDYSATASRSRTRSRSSKVQQTESLAIQEVTRRTGVVGLSAAANGGEQQTFAV